MKVSLQAFGHNNLMSKNGPEGPTTNNSSNQNFWTVMDARRTTNILAPLCGHCRKPKISFIIFITILVIFIIVTIVFFVLIVLNLTFVYVGIGCLGATALLVVGYYVSFRVHSIVKRRRMQQQHENSPPAAAHAQNVIFTTPGIRANEYRRLERELQQLLHELTELQTTALCNASDLETVRDLARRENARLAEWIEGIKTPDETEVAQLSTALRHLAARVQAIRTRSRRIATWLSVRRLPAHLDISLSSRPPPPSYTDSQLHFQPPPRTVTSQSALHYLPSFASDTASLRAPPSDGGAAPPAYLDVVGTPI